MEKYLVICHISKVNNVRQLVRVAIAYDFIPILVGTQTFKDDVMCVLSEAKRDPTSFLEFDKLSAAKKYLCDRAVPLIGIEIIDGAHSVLNFRFPSSFAIMPGNEGTGLNDKQKSLSDCFVYIPQYGTGTASLNVHVATTLVLHQSYMQSEALLSVPTC